MSNETYKIKVGSPLLRPGLSIETTVSGKYVVPTTKALIEKVRGINGPSEDEEILKKFGINSRKISRGRK
jgi:hypothetical protein